MYKLLIFRVNIEETASFFPKFLHDKCRIKLQRQAKTAKMSIKSKGLTKHSATWMFKSLPDFPNPRRKQCGHCHQYPDPPHNISTCPVRLDTVSKGGRKKKPLMDLSDKKQGKDRIQSLIDHFEKFCEVSGENEKDVLAFQYRRQLNKEGKIKSAKTFENFHYNPSQILIKPLSPRKVASRTVMMGASWNKSRSVAMVLFHLCEDVCLL